MSSKGFKKIDLEMTFIQKFRELFQVKKDNSSLMSFISVKILFATIQHDLEVSSSKTQKSGFK